ncbi:protein-L-isoaspartate O-methyltransferase family protein [Edaphobacter albus]|uniref:protein-L-isoaspartate O-methyltransferase family protein n=1 Tax=Edaphobacter sp. 4G125 TaxID=2763071 RepID=UPI002105AD6C|nr:protein-L-isoaspartate(D-aspartate) O-methyltransferase [Edaphobacter sp. 4G125]
MAAKAGVSLDSPIAKVFGEIPRERFVGDPPWRVFADESEGELVDDPALLYRDVLVQLKHEGAINNGQPSLHAICLASLHLRSGEVAIHVGAGTGYYTAMLALLVGAAGRVDAYEIENDLAEEARKNLKEMIWVKVHTGSGTLDPLPECDVLYVSAGATSPLSVWLDSLRMGGRLLFPLTPEQGYGGMLLIARQEMGYSARFLCGAKFVGCEGGRDARTAEKLEGCFRKGHVREVRSLWRNDAPDETAWCAGDGWWLSTREIHEN